jgi:hypothetical protein
MKGEDHMRDLKSNIGFDISLASAARTASANGNGSDLKGFEGVVAVILPGTITDGTHTPKLQESDDNATFTDVAASDMLGSFVNIASNTAQKVGYIGIKRYVRLVSTVAGATTGGVYTGIIVKGVAAGRPVA